MQALAAELGALLEANAALADDDLEKLPASEFIIDLQQQQARRHNNSTTTTRQQHGSNSVAASAC